MSDALTAYGSPGRGGHRLSTLGGQLVERVRQRVANLLGMAGSDRVVFTPGATYSLAFALQGLLKRGDHVIATSFDHSSVLRSLEQLRRYHGVLVTVVRHNAADDTLVDAVAADIRPQTRLICVNHASNVTGAILPCSALIELAHRQGAHVLVDASQSIGHVTFDLAELPADMVAFGGHKALLGPAGVGCLAIANPDIRLTPTVTGGTGYDSGNLDPHLVTPSSYEVGTLNVPAIAGLEAALVFREHGNPRAQQFALTALREDCIERLRGLSGIRIYASPGPSVPIVSFNLDGWLPERVSAALDGVHQIQTRAGLHCAPLAHIALGMGPYGCVRASFGWDDDSDAPVRLTEAIKQLVRHGDTPS